MRICWGAARSTTNQRRVSCDFPPKPPQVEADRGEDLGTVHRSLPLSEYLHALNEEKKAKAAKIAENGGGGGGGSSGDGSESKKKRNKSKKAEVSERHDQGGARNVHHIDLEYGGEN